MGLWRTFSRRANCWTAVCLDLVFIQHFWNAIGGVLRNQRTFSPQWFLANVCSRWRCGVGDARMGCVSQRYRAMAGRSGVALGTISFDLASGDEQQVLFTR